MANKVLHVITTIERGGAENQLLVLIREQIESGWQVEVMPLKGSLDLTKEFENLGAKVDLSIHNLKVPLQILKLRNSQRADYVIHAHLPRAELISTFVRGKGRFIITRHNAEKFMPSAPSLISNLLSRFVLQRCDAAIAISNAVRDYGFEVGDVPKTQQVIVIYYGFNPEVYYPEKNPTESNVEGITRLCAIGRLVPQKDYPTLIKGFARAAQNLADIKLYIVGDGFQREEIQNLARRLGVQDRTVWLGKIKDVRQLLNDSHVFILASKYEGFGLVLLEAIQSGITVLSSSSAAAVEVLGIDYPGFFSPGDAEMLAVLIGRCNDENFTRDLQSKARERLLRFTPKQMAQQTTEVYLRESWS